VRLGRHGINKNEKVELIKSVPLFARCSRKELGEIAALADEIDLREGKTLIRQGERGREFFVLLEGEVDVARDGESIQRMKAGDFFGEIALVSNVPRTASVTATSPVRVLVVVDRDFRTLLEHTPQIQLKVLEALAERLAQLQQL
jgi:CRP-like cAMP-binding protein